MYILSFMYWVGKKIIPYRRKLGTSEFHSHFSNSTPFPVDSFEKTGIKDILNMQSQISTVNGSKYLQFLSDDQRCMWFRVVFLEEHGTGFF